MPWQQMTNEAYHSGPGISNSGLQHFADSPGHYKAYLDEEFEETDAMREGSGFHTWVLENELFNKEYRVVEGTRTKKMKEEAEEEGITLLTSKQGDNIQKWSEAILEHEHAVKLLKAPGVIEQSGFWDHPKYGCLCKIRLDKRIPSLKTLADLKTISTARARTIDLEENFQSAIANYKYHWQAQLYLEGASFIEGEEYSQFCWIIVEKEAPHQVAVMMADVEMLYEASQDIDLHLEHYAECLESNTWPKPVYPGIRPATLPGWYYKRKEEVIYG